MYIKLKGWEFYDESHINDFINNNETLNKIVNDKNNLIAEISEYSFNIQNKNNEVICDLSYDGVNIY